MGLDLDIVELDGRIAHIAEKYFKYDPSSADLYIDDARHFIRKSDEKYDVVVIDLLVGEVQPTHVFSLEGFEELKKVLEEDALVIINFQGDLEDPKYSLGPKSIFKTLQKAGFHVDYYWSGKKGKDDITKDIFFIASLEKQDYKSMMQNLRYNKWFPYEDFKYNNLITDEPLDLNDAIILTDDKPKLEHLNAATILQWRKNKIQRNVKRLLEEKQPIY